MGLCLRAGHTPSQTTQPGRARAPAQCALTGNALQPSQVGANGSITNGFGYFRDGINSAASSYPPRSGPIVARFQF
jgi:hypothetical protein